MSTTAIVVFACLVAFGLIPAFLIGRTTKENADKLNRIGVVAEAEVITVFVSDDAIVKFKFLLPDNRTTLTCTHPLPFRYSKTLRPGDRISVRYNPKCPAINRLEPDTPTPAAKPDVSRQHGSEPAA